ncbi:MAG: hypothetical protein E6792_05025, partial [Streptococcus thermophilus]|nr:hypothetical protein [Streptococcus thermophilus]
MSVLSIVMLVASIFFLYLVIRNINKNNILFEQAKIHTTDIASLYYYRALVNFHNERIEEARICIDKSLQLEPRRRKAVVIKECVDMYVP